MVVETQPVAFLEWLPLALWFLLQAVLALSFLALVIGYVISGFRYGPLAGGDVTFRVVRSAFHELFQLSPRRIYALARLAVQESIRRRVLVASVVFLLILLFAGWFLDTNSPDPSTLYLSFVLTATTYLVLLMALFLSAFSLPADMKSRTIHTVVTKPVRAGEIVLGRILGFSAIGTVLLAAMGLCSYVFVVRVLNHTHEVDAASLKTLTGSNSDMRVRQTTRVQGHRHEVILDLNKPPRVEPSRGHTHAISTTKGPDGATRYVLSQPQGMLRARVPVYGKLRFMDRSGKPGAGVNVGNEWTYRSFIEGGTLASAIWTFNDVSEKQYMDGLPLELNIRVFRTYKGKITEGILGSLVVKNPKRNVASAIQTFRAKDFEIDTKFIPRNLLDTNGKPIDLFKDLVEDGQVEIVLQCLDQAQYYGVAQADMYLRKHDAPFSVNFLKGYLGIWLQMILVTSFGVMFSTFLSGAVAMMATLSTLVLGFFASFVFKVAQGEIKGGGPLESLVRLVQQRNVVTEMDDSLTKIFVQSIDYVIMGFMTALTTVLPDFTRFSNANYVAYGFDIPWDNVLTQFTTVLAYVAAVFVIGYFFLKTREVAR